MRCPNLDESKNEFFIKSNFISFVLANEESSLIKMELDDNDQEERYSIHSLVQDSYSPLGVILRRERGEEKKTVN
jgi:hypothetical protein